eukprot:2205152-Lingulodinium_polyedra.AAC.1
MLCRLLCDQHRQRPAGQPRPEPCSAPTLSAAADDQRPQRPSPAPQHWPLTSPQAATRTAAPPRAPTTRPLPPCPWPTAPAGSPTPSTTPLAVHPRGAP